MSSFFPNAEHSISPPRPSGQNHPDLAALAATLQETAQDLLDFAHASASNAGTCHHFNDTPSLKTPQEFRTYRIPGSIVDEERELLKAYNVQDWQELISAASYRLRTICTLLRHYEVEEAVDGFFLNQVAENLLAPVVDMLEKSSSLIADFRLVAQDG